MNFIDEASAFRTIYISSQHLAGRRLGHHHLLSHPFQCDISLHEAAKVDGANTLQRILHIDVPALVPISSSS